MGLWKSLKVHFEGKTGIHIGDAGTVDKLKGEKLDCFSLSSFYRSWSLSTLGGRGAEN